MKKAFVFVCGVSPGVAVAVVKPTCDLRQSLLFEYSFPLEVGGDGDYWNRVQSYAKQQQGIE